LNFGHSRETGYLSEPYKIVSLLNADGNTADYRTEKRPGQRTTQNIFLASAYQISEDVLHVSYRFYWDNWGIRSHTVDLKYRFDVAPGNYLEPHLRFYSQTAADFFTYGLLSSAPIPKYATSDSRYGKMNSNTIGAKYGIDTGSGELSFRLEYMAQSGNGHPNQAVGSQKQWDLFPTINVVILQIGYSVDF
jgi:hypothetical protein